ncbi:unnamed protein product [Penicillium salamii]|uniref:Uncharacterized protein n=1 Tax=Penicillium salamii TaxID=1612424 RepID=A0A9W4JIT3_9EURO|nr:unnamed protein product [Penicillium salamii]CAG8275716.1 unnamed protein product [Penicillium salamii]CAG8284668.1 unnamed protein product [Penicillium salamii]CAG8289771.1 unnamed protein product [Penicillium salamii]CAG8356692.1 unnamed protein product [Penicillium salamii]
MALIKVSPASDHSHFTHETHWWLCLEHFVPGSGWEINILRSRFILSDNIQVPPVLSGAAAEFFPDDLSDGVDGVRDHVSVKVDNPNMESGSAGEKADSHSKGSRSQGIAAPGDFLAQFHKLRILKEKAAKAAAAGVVRRVVFGDLPEWATISRILLLTHGGAIEQAWSEDGTVVVQFVEEKECLDYHEKHSAGIKYMAADGNEAVITVTLPEEGLPDNAALADRVAEGASRVVCLAGIAPGFKVGDDDISVLGVLAQDGWEGMKFERILITQAESGVDVTISFYDLHDGWKFMQDIKEGTYDCIPRFEVDPCALASTYHFIDEPNPAFEAIRG